MLHNTVEGPSCGRCRETLLTRVRRGDTGAAQCGKQGLFRQRPELRTGGHSVTVNASPSTTGVGGEAFEVQLDVVPARQSLPSPARSCRPGRMRTPLCHRDIRRADRRPTGCRGRRRSGSRYHGRRKSEPHPRKGCSERCADVHHGPITPVRWAMPSIREDRGDPDAAGDEL